MISKTKINQRIKKKTNSYLVETLMLAKKQNPELASKITIPTRKQAKVNINKINKADGDSFIIPGKVLASGKIDRKVKIYALSFSEQALKQLREADCECQTILDALKKGEKIKGEFLR